MRVVPGPGRCDTDRTEQLADPGVRRLACRLGFVGADRLGDLVTDRHHRVEPVHGALEHQ